MTNLKINSQKKIVIIPDIHNNFEKAEKIIAKETPDNIIFLGDYFDDFDDTIQDADNTAKWLKKSLKQKNRIHLIGNHDVSYMTDNPNLKCAGYDIDKHKIIKKHKIDWKKLEMFCWINDEWLCTHAGFTNEFYKQQSPKDHTIQQVLESSKNDLKNIDNVNYFHIFFQVGFFRGGTNTVGGILWCDYDEFVDIPKIRQIFGHTKNPHIQHKKTKNSEHYCIDTGLNHYAIYQNNTMKIKSTSS